MEFSKVQHFINEIERNRETIASQQAEIERLRAELEAYKTEVTRLQNKVEKHYTEKLSATLEALQPEPPQESLTPAELGEMAGRKVRVLRYMEEQTLVRPSIYALQRLFGNDIKETMIELRNDGLVWEYPSKNNTYHEYVLTPQGMDYLANNEPETLQRATSTFVECPQCHQQTLNLVHEFCSECDYIKAE